MPGYRPSRGEEPLSNGLSDCEPIMEWRCEIGEFRNILGQCEVDDLCEGECDGRPATRSANNGLCYCLGEPSVDFYCNNSCRQSALLASAPTLSKPT